MQQLTNLPQTAIIVGNTHGFLREIANPLARADFRVKAYIPPGDRLWRSETIEKVEVPDLEGEPFINYLLANTEISKESGWFFWNSLEKLQGIARSELSDELRSRFLNGLEIKYLNILGSRVNQVNMFKELNLPHPKSWIVRGTDTHDEINFEGPLLLKSDFGGSGTGIIDFSPEGFQRYKREAILDKPFLVQAKIEGETVHVELLYDAGEIIYWAYSKNNKSFIGYGYCPYRDYQAPSNLDFLESLKLIGRTLNISGPVGAAFVLDSSGNHFLIEFDLNAGLWHHLFEEFNSMVVGGAEKERGFQPSRSIKYYDPYRALDLAVLSWNLVDCYRIVLGLPIKNGYEPMPSHFYVERNIFKQSIMMTLKILRRTLKVISTHVPKIKTVNFRS